MKYALIGCGRIAVNHIKAVLANDLELVAVCDIEASQMESLLQQYGMEKDANIQRYTDHRALLHEHPELEVAAIATESGRHAEIAVDCIMAGINVIIEKPIAMSVRDADRICRLAKEKGVKVCTCHQNRFNIAVQKMRHAVECGRFGRISHGAVHVRWNRGRDYYAQASWRGKWASDGGALMNQCIHGIDLLLWMMNDEPVEVYGVTEQRLHPYLEAEDIGAAIIRFKNGSLATIEGTTNVYPRNLEETLYLFGETGTVKLGGKSVNTVEVWNFADEADGDMEIREIAEQTANVYGNGHTALYADMIDAIKNDRVPYVDGEAGRSALELVLAIYKSRKTGKPVALPLKDFASKEMEGTFSHKEAIW